MSTVFRGFVKEACCGGWMPVRRDPVLTLCAAVGRIGEMVRLLHVLEMLVGFVRKNPWLSAFVLCAVCAVVSRVAVPPFLHNDDCQIQFLLADGGMFSFYTNVCLASVLGWLSVAAPAVSWYLVILACANFAALWCVTGCALEGAFARRKDGGRMEEGFLCGPDC